MLFPNPFSRLFRLGPCEKRRGAKNDRIAKERRENGGEGGLREGEETKLIPEDEKTKLGRFLLMDATKLQTCE